MSQEFIIFLIINGNLWILPGAGRAGSTRGKRTETVLLLRVTRRTVFGVEWFRMVTDDGQTLVALRNHLQTLGTQMNIFLILQLFIHYSFIQPFSIPLNGLLARHLWPLCFFDSIDRPPGQRRLPHHWDHPVARSCFGHYCPAWSSCWTCSCSTWYRREPVAHAALDPRKMDEILARQSCQQVHHHSSTFQGLRTSSRCCCDAPRATRFLSSFSITAGWSSLSEPRGSKQHTGTKSSRLADQDWHLDASRDHWSYCSLSPWTGRFFKCWYS